MSDTKNSFNGGSWVPRERVRPIHVAPSGIVCEEGGHIIIINDHSPPAAPTNEN